MSSFARVGIARLGYNNLTRQLCKVTATNHVPVAFITGKAKRVDKRPLLKPFDYLNKTYGLWAQLLDPMIDRMDDNSKLIVVEGPIAAGKTNLAQKLADELEMLYLPPPTFDEYYITNYGYDIRSLDDRLSQNLQSCDVQKFLTNPHHVNVTMFQFNYFQLKLDQYITALLHILSTGQGIVLDRSFYSDFVFAKAMTSAGYMRPEALQFYYRTKSIAKATIMRPHLIIYLDMPVDVVMENIKKRNIPYEVNSKVLTREYLQDIEDSYKDYLKESITHSNILIYDWAEEGDINNVVEDIEMLNFDDYTRTDKKLEDWRFESVEMLRNKRLIYQDRQVIHMDYVWDDINVPEMSYSPEENIERSTVLENIPGEAYAPGFNADEGDEGILWKTNVDSKNKFLTLRSRPRDIEIIREELKKLKANAFR